jgi:hypothetical protein
MTRIGGGADGAGNYGVFTWACRCGLRFQCEAADEQDAIKKSNRRALPANAGECVLVERDKIMRVFSRPFEAPCDTGLVAKFEHHDLLKDYVLIRRSDAERWIAGVQELLRAAAGVGKA